MSDTYARRNQEYWNHAAEAVYKDKWVHDLQYQILDFLKSHVDWLALPKDIQENRPAKMMDYACGNGIVTRSLHRLFSQCIGIDITESMLDKYRATAIDIGLSESQIVAVQGNLLGPFVETTKPPLDREQLSNFDLVAICMALHHVDDIDMAIKRLSERLRPGGVLLVVDWAKRDTASNSAGMDSQNAHHQHQHQYHHPQHQNQPHPASHTISHDSFTEEQMVGLFDGARCGHSSFVLAERLSDVPGARTGKMQLFFARATKL
ncbi:Methyltransferase domain-containing protein [Colletotrichum higginsianum IMI 349063]|uniref:Methyltransferase domain-containing protein n=1 Tax=Colletotrichum higginsianum (strain IMI 349063) TaxID=759273 RepID=A0A1B7XUX2_COLHI|nr:Methyltransferase domain-containing protein [Colletotrichum higginsianum IMI 349063]OBR03540.1 Methyltransferase domain-containing protein [Colletotrichum higginsianum IMI 349063]GJD02119.1 methyltransferase domain-containing protein [Colletotrichum higginsianum]